MSCTSRLPHHFILSAVALAPIAFLLVARAGFPSAKGADATHPAPRVIGEPPRQLSAKERERRLAELRGGIARAVADVDKRLAGPNPEPSIRDLPNAAFAKLLLGQDPREAEHLVELSFQQQEMDEKSPAVGMLPWQTGHPEIHDDNAIEFGTQLVGPMLIAFGDKLSPQFKKDLVPHVKAAFAAMDRRNFKTPAYTNIYLMRAVSMILLGEALADSKAADEGYAQLDAWIDYTREAGIHEFDSPTYYCTDLNSLTLGYLYAARPGAREKFKTVLDYFWTDMAANYFIPNECLSGPHSRNYDFLHSWGGLDLYFYVEGFCGSGHVPHPDLEKTCVLLAGDEKAYHPPQSAFDLAAKPERIIISRWDTDPNRTRYHYVTSDFAIGSASGGDYNAQDKLICVEMASPKKLPVLAVVPDTFDAPYGREKSLDRSGHSKPTHLPYRPVAVQEKGVVLALLDIDPANAPETKSLATNILLPAAADVITLDGKPVSMSKPFEQPAPLDSVIGVREGSAGVAIRVFTADGVAGQEAVPLLKADAAGLKEGTARLAVYHYRGESRKFDAGGKQKDEPGAHIRVGLLMIAGRCPADADFDALLRTAREAKVDSTDRKGVWDVRAAVGSVRLEASRDLAHKKVVSRSVGEVAVKAMPLEINGEDAASRIWQALTR